MSSLKGKRTGKMSSLEGKRTGKSIVDTLTMMWRLDRTMVTAMAGNALIGAVIPCVGIYLSEYVLDHIGPGCDVEALFKVVFASVGAVFVLMVASGYLKKLCEVHRDICIRRFDMEMGKRTLTMDYELLDSPAVNELRTRMRNDQDWGAGFYSIIEQSDYFMQQCLSLGIAIFVLAPLFTDSRALQTPWTALLALCFGAVILVSGVYLAKCRERLFQMFSKYSESLGYEEYFLYRPWNYREGKDIRIYQGQELLLGHMEEKEAEAGRKREEITESQSRSGLVSGGSSGLLQVLAWLFVVLRAVSGALTVGAMMKYAAAIYRFSQALAEVCNAASGYAAAAKRSQSTLEYLNVKDVLYRGSLPVEKGFFCEERDNDYEIEFRNVSFRYPSSEQYALKDFSFTFRTGERLAVVGRNGSGKTTFIKLLCRLYDPTEGEILLNGIDIRKYDYEEYKSIFSVVFQDFRLFSFSLAENVAASISNDRKRVAACLEKAGLGAWLENLEAGIDTYLYTNYDEAGIEISGGEAQKVALARALYKDAPFIILDEPTAALDPVAEFEIYSRFNEIVGEKTAVYISHRLSSCRFCNDIAVFDEGKLVQRGSHQELVADRSGKYYELWQAQAQYYEETGNRPGT